MSIVNRGLGFTKTLIMKGLGLVSEADGTNNNVREYSILIESNIKPKHFFYPLTGVFSENENVTGWKYSKSIPQDLNNIYQRIEGSLGGYEYNLEEGSIRKDWEGAVLEGIKLDRIIKEYKRNYSSEWRPLVTPGVYSIYWVEKSLLADESSSLLLEKQISTSTEVDDEGNEITFEEMDPFVDLPYGSSNVQITVFKRDRYFVNIPWSKYSITEENDFNVPYTFEIEDIEATDTTQEKTQLKVSDFFELQVGLRDAFDHEANSELIENFEFAGIGHEYRSIIYTEYFPIINVRLFEETLLLDNTSTLEEWVEVTSFSHENKKEFIVDHSCGKITINKSENKDYFCEGYLFETGEIIFFDTLEDWPLDKGFIEVNGNRYEYYEKMQNSIFIKPPTVPFGNDFDRGSKISFLKEGANFSTLTNLWVGYTCIPRVDFELNPRLRTTNANVKPYTKIDSNGILEINPYEKHVSRISVESDLVQNTDNTYGPLFMGGESTKITSTVFNSHGTPIKELPVTFHTDLGKFNSESNIKKSITNQNGEAFCYYSWPYNEQEDHILIENFEHVDGDTIITVSGHSVGNNSAEANIFQVTKDDPFYGSLGWESSCKRINEDDDYIYITLNEDLPNLEEYFTNQMLYEEYEALSSNLDFEDFVSEHSCQELLVNYCLGFIKHIDLTKGMKKIIIDKIINKDTIAIKHEFLSDRTFFINIVNSPVVLYKRNEMVFDPELVKSGFSYDRVMYYDNGETLVPIKPSSTRLPNGNIRITYSGIELEKPSMEDSSNIIAAYKMYVDRLARIWAEAIDPATGRIVKSNTIKIIVSLPRYLKGDHGFKILSDDDTSSGLGGGNFIVVNEIEAQNEYNELASNSLVTISPFHKNRINFFINNEE